MRLFKHRHNWQERGINRYGVTTYRMCLKCRQTEKRRGNEFVFCQPIKELDLQFNVNDKYIF